MCLRWRNTGRTSGPRSEGTARPPCTENAAAREHCHERQVTTWPSFARRYIAPPKPSERPGDRGKGSGMFAGRAGLFDNRQEGKRTYGIDAMPQGYRDHSPPPRGLRRLRTDTVGGANPNVAGVFDASGALRPKPRQQGVRYVEKRPVTIAFNETIVTKTRAAAAEETPVAWPSHPKYPPDADASGALIDYALVKHGGKLRAARGAHPEVVASRANQRPTQPHQFLRSRGPPQDQMPPGMPRSKSGAAYDAFRSTSRR